MSSLKNEEAFLDKVQDAIAVYSGDNNDLNFVVTIKVVVRDGWTKAIVIEE